MVFLIYKKQNKTKRRRWGFIGTVIISTVASGGLGGIDMRREMMIWTSSKLTQISKGRKENNPATSNFHLLFHWDFGLFRFNGDRRTRLGFSLVSVSREERETSIWESFFFLFFMERFGFAELQWRWRIGGLELD